MKSLSDTTLTALVLFAGALLPLQAVINGRLGVQLANPFWASTFQNLIGASLMALVILALRTAPPPAGQIAAVPMWVWIGGFLGAVYVLCALLATPRLGATRAMAAVITGQLVASVALDHFGLLQARRPIDLRTLGGLVLLAGGAALILGRK
jgi:transporter family-2 protein